MIGSDETTVQEPAVNRQKSNGCKTVLNGNGRETTRNGRKMTENGT